LTTFTACDLDVEQLLDGGLHVGLGRVCATSKTYWLAFPACARVFSETAARASTLQQTFSAHASHSSIFLTESTVINTLSAPTRS
jgi:hypothetical protein